MINPVQELWDLVGTLGVIDQGDFHVIDVTDEEDMEDMNVIRIYHRDGWCVQIKGFYDEDEIGEHNEPEYDEDEDDDEMFNDDPPEGWPLPVTYEFSCIWSQDDGISLAYVINLIKDYKKNKEADIDDLINKTLNL